MTRRFLHWVAPYVVIAIGAALIVEAWLSLTLPPAGQGTSLAVPSPSDSGRGAVFALAADIYGASAPRSGLNPATPQSAAGATPVRTCGALCGRGPDGTGAPNRNAAESPGGLSFGRAVLSGAVASGAPLDQAGVGGPATSPPARVVVPAIALAARPWTHTNATWYCLPGRSRCTAGFPASCLCGAVSPDLRYLGHHVTVCAGKVCVGVRVVDCRCAGTSGLDLYASVFRRLAPLGTGILRVRVR